MLAPLRRLILGLLERYDDWFDDVWDVDLGDLDDEVFPPRLDTP